MRCAMKLFSTAIVLLAVITWYSYAYADEKIVVVINADSNIEQLTKEEVINIFLGRFRQFSAGTTAQPIDQMDQTKRALFYKKLVGKELADINSYWARLIFSGKTKPPRQANNVEDLIRLINTVPGAVGYMEISEINSNVKVAFTLY